MLALLATQASLENLGGRGALAMFVAAMPLNFYAILSILLVFAVVTTGWDFGPMRRAERRACDEGQLVGTNARPVVADDVMFPTQPNGIPPRARNLVVPLLVMVGMVAAGIAITGGTAVRQAGIATPSLMHYLDKASGSTAVLWGVLSALIVLVALLRVSGAIRIRDAVYLCLRGAGAMLPIATLLALAFGIGMTCGALDTGPFIAGRLTPYLTPVFVAPLVFLVSSFIAFSTGTSFGTFAILIPLALPLAASMNLQGAEVSLPLVVSAVLGGGVFGDHCSPISDTTLISSMAAWSDHTDHVRTQLPYALLAAGGSMMLYVITGLVLRG